MQTKSEVQEKVINLIADQANTNPANISLETNLFASLFWDSLDFIDFVDVFEEAFEVKVPDQHLKKLLNVGDFVNYACLKMGVKE